MSTNYWFINHNNIPLGVLYVCCMCAICVLYVCCVCAIFVLYVCCMCAVCVLYVCCMCAVCVLYVCCMCAVCVLYVCCMCAVCVLYVCCMCAVCVLYVCCMCAVCVLYLFPVMPCILSYSRLGCISVYVNKDTITSRYVNIGQTLCVNIYFINENFWKFHCVEVNLLRHHYLGTRNDFKFLILKFWC